MLSDYNMPRMNGIELQSRVKEHSPRTVRMLITGYSDLAIDKEAINRASIDFFLEKPWNNQELLDYIGNAIDLFNIREQLGLGTEEEEPEPEPPDQAVQTLEAGHM